MTNWNAIAETLKSKMDDKQPEIKMKDEMQWFGLASPSVAQYYLKKLEDMGIVRREQNGEYSKWYLA